MSRTTTAMLIVPLCMLALAAVTPEDIGVQFGYVDGQFGYAVANADDDDCGGDACDDSPHATRIDMTTVLQVRLATRVLMTMRIPLRPMR